jgi:hypothetical protein
MKKAGGGPVSKELSTDFAAVKTKPLGQVKLLGHEIISTLPKEIVKQFNLEGVLPMDAEVSDLTLNYDKLTQHFAIRIVLKIKNALAGEGLTAQGEEIATGVTCPKCGETLGV